jgi:hypothetical protein
LLAVLPDSGLDLPDVLVDLVTVIAPHRRHELTWRGLFEEAGRLGLGIWLHVWPDPR